MIDSKEKMRKVIHETGSLLEDTKQNDTAEKAENVEDDKNTFQDEVAKREKEAFLEGYRYAIKVLEDGLVKDRL